MYYRPKTNRRFAENSNSSRFGEDGKEKRRLVDTARENPEATAAIIAVASTEVHRRFIEPMTNRPAETSRAIAREVCAEIGRSAQSEGSEAAVGFAKSLTRGFARAVRKRFFT